MVTNAALRPPTPLESRLLEELRKVQFGSVEVIIQDGQLMRIEVRQSKKLT